MWFVRIRKERRAYYDAAEVVRRTARIESKLETCGGSGNGIYEKYKRLAHFFPPETEEKIIELGTIRNRVVHGNPKIENPRTVFKLCKELEKVIDRNTKPKKRLLFFKSFAVMTVLLAVAVGIWEIYRYG